jgi:hypothetical protein
MPRAILVIHRMRSGLSCAPMGSQRWWHGAGVHRDKRGRHPIPWFIGCIAVIAPVLAGCRKPPPVVPVAAGGTTMTRALVATGVSAALQARYGCEMGGCSPGYECREQTRRCEPVAERPDGEERPPATSDLDPLESSSSVVFSADGTLELTGLDDRVSHSHGGPPAQIVAVSVGVRNFGAADVVLRPTQAELLTSHECEVEPRHVSATLAVHGLRQVREQTPLAASHTVAARDEPELMVFFEPAEVTYGHCDRYAIRITFEVGSEQLRPVAEVWVTRESDAPP